MEFALGFIIAVFIALTGVGAGSLTTPLLILLLGLPAKQCVGTALIFGTVVKILSVPGYMLRKQVDWRVFGYLTAAGVPRRLMVDASHGNSGKDHTRHIAVAESLARQVADG